MSLINQMLRDLESRRTAPAMAAGNVATLALAAQRAADVGMASAPPSGKSDAQAGGSQRWLIVIIVLLTVLLGLLLWTSQPPWQGRTQPASTAAVSAIASSAVPTVTPTAVASVPVVQMTVEPAAPVVPARAEPVAAVASAAPAAAAKAKAITATPSAAPSAVAEKTALEPPTHPIPATPSPQSLASSPQSLVLSPESSSLSPEPTAPVSKRIRPLSNEQRAELALRRGVELLGQGRQVEAEQALLETLRLDARQLRARETLAALYFNSGRYAEAQPLLTEGLRLSPRAAGLAQLYARLLSEQGDLATALTVLQRASPPLAQNPDYHALLAALYQRAAQHEAAAWVYRQLLAQHSTQATWWMGLGISLEALGDITPALEAYVKAHQLGAGLSSQVIDYLGTRIRALAPRVAAEKAAASAKTVNNEE